jgi:uncharacterized protein
MNDHPNTMLMKRAYEAFAAQDLETLGDLIAEDAVWRQPGNNPIAGEYQGRDAIFDYFGKLLTFSDGTFKAEPIDILADDERVMVLQHTTAKRNGQNYDTRDVLVCEVKDGKFVDTQVFESEPALEDSFWAG